MTAGHEVFPQFLKIVNLAVEDDPDRLILIGHRLRAASHIDNREAKVAQAHRTIEMYTVPIGSAVAHHGEHF